jgi:hypothetical protein
MSTVARSLVLVSVLLAACSDDGAGGSGATGGGGTAGSGAGNESGGGGEAGASTNGGGGSGGAGAAGGGGTGGTGGAGGGSNAFAELCAYRAASCGVDEAACLAQESCARGFLRDEVEDSLFACLTQTCDEDTCFMDTMMIPLSALGTDVQGDCLAAVGSCKGNFTGAEACYSGSYLADPLLAELAECIALSCFSIDPCVGMVFDQLDTCEDWI